MIAKIEPPMSAFYDVIKYHENKVSSGVATLLHSDLIGDSIASKTHEFANITDLKPDKKNLCKHISLNFPHGEILSDEMLFAIAFEYKNRLGYDNTPCLLYKHQDKKHQHVHLVMPTVDYDGNNIRDSFEHDRSFAISRQLEKEFNLRNLDQNLAPKQHYTFNEIFAKQHSFQSAFKRCWGDEKSKPFLLDFLTKDEQDKLWNKKPVSNDSVLKLLGNDRFTTLMSFFDHKGYSTKYNKDYLVSVLDKTLPESYSKSDFFTRLSASSIDVSLVSKNGKNNYVYSCPSLLFSIKDTRLPKTYSYESLSRTLRFDPSGFVLPTEQKHILYNILHLSLDKSSTFNEFLFNCNKNGADFEFKNDSLFFRLPCENAVDFDSGLIHKKLSLDKISAHFTQDSPSVVFPEPVINDISLHHKQNYPDLSPLFSSTTGSGKDYSKEEDLNLKRKKQKKRGNSLNL